MGFLSGISKVGFVEKYGLNILIVEIFNSIIVSTKKFKNNLSLNTDWSLLIQKLIKKDKLIVRSAEY